MSKGRLITTWVLTAIAVTIFVGWRVYGLHHAEAPPYVALIHDSSGSDEAGCGAIRAVAVSLLTLPDIAVGSQLALLGTGDKTNGYEGRLIRVFDVPVDRRVMEGKNAARRKQDEFGDAVKKACEATPVKEQSPILQSVKDAIDHLRANQCNTSSACLLYVVTDGEENVEPVVRAALNGSRDALSKLRGQIENHGIRVTFCGFAQSKVSSQGHRTSAERLKTVWTALFSDPSLVTVAPYCESRGAQK